MTTGDKQRPRGRRREASQAEQLELPVRTWGGRRKGAGRPKSRTSRAPHTRREDVVARYPLHVTWKLEEDLPNVRGLATARVIMAAIAAGKEREGFRVVHFCIQGRHLHLLTEADSKEALAKGLRGLGIRIARAINKVLARKGRVIKERYNSRALKTPTETRHSLRYVINNTRKHRSQRNEVVNRDWADPLSSERWFDGWRQGWAPPPSEEQRPVASPRTWLLSVGWQKAGGLLDLNEIPGPTREAALSRERLRLHGPFVAGRRSG